MKVSIVVVSVLLASAGAASCNMPHMGGDMKHVMVHRMMDDVMVMVDTMVPTPDLQNYGEMYMGNAAVLNDTWYNWRVRLDERRHVDAAHPRVRVDRADLRHPRAHGLQGR